MSKNVRKIKWTFGSADGYSNAYLSAFSAWVTAKLEAEYTDAEVDVVFNPNLIGGVREIDADDRDSVIVFIERLDFDNFERAGMPGHDESSDLAED